MILRLLALILSFSLLAPSVVARESADSLKCRPGVVQSVVSAVGGVVINAAATEALKAAVHERRPDGSDNHSFPSRHTSYAFTLATVASQELYRYSPFFVSAAHTVANAVAMQRVMAHRHYPGDVFAGAGLGFLSAELGYYIGGRIFHHKNCDLRLPALDNTYALTSATTALIPLSSYSDGIAAGCGIESSLGVNIPLAEKFGVLAEIALRSQSVYADDLFVGTLDGCGLKAGGYFFRSWGLWAFDLKAAAGVVYSFRRPLDCSSDWSGLFDLTAGVSRRIARRLSLGANLGLDFADRPGSSIAMTAALSVKAEF